MKKWTLGVIMAAAVLAGCGSSDEREEAVSPPENQEVVENAPEEPAIPNEAEDEEGADQVAEVQTFEMPDLDLFEVINPYFEASAGSLSLEEAARVGSAYIWDVLGSDLNGLAMQLTYTSPAGIRSSWWSGQVGASREALENLEMMYWFLIDAYTGQRVDLTDMHTPENRWAQAAEGGSLSVAGGSQGSAGRAAEFEAPSMAELQEYQRLAEGFATSHFNETGVAEVVPHPQWAFNPDGSLTFLATDDSGRVAEITVQMETRVLMRISTQHNDNVDTQVSGGTG